MPIVYLDSNIYRQLGLRFIDNIDYKNLSQLLETSGNEFGLLEVVCAELLDYYKNDVFGTILSDHEKLYKRYQANPYLDDIEIPETTIPLNKAIQNIQKDLKTKKFFSSLPEVPPQLLLDFLLHNKRLGKKDNTRDFLILHTIIELCKEHTEDYLVLISQDEIFTTNEFFKKVLTREKINNLKNFASIADFLKDFGPKLDFITKESLLEQIDTEVIRKELLYDIKCFPSYASQFYCEKTDKEVPDIENLDIQKVNVYDFYIVKDYIKDVLKVNISVRVDMKAIFQPEAQKEELEQYLNTLPLRRYSRHQNHFDKEGRPIFENGVLFIFEGDVNFHQKKVENISFIDFIPDYFIIEEISQQLSQQKRLEALNQCAHEFDTNNGYWRHSRYGGGLSWHYRCKKCGAEYDTGDYFE